MVRAMADSTPDEIEQQLAAIRSVLKRDVRDLVSEARELIDWRCHFRAHPWLYCGGAAALGFLLVPRGRRRLKVEAAVVDGASGDQPFVVRAPAAVVPQAESLLETALRFAATMLVKESLGYLMQRVRRDGGPPAAGNG